jgi:hypothetical protein
MEQEFKDEPAGRAARQHDLVNFRGKSLRQESRTDAEGQPAARSPPNLTLQIVKAWGGPRCRDGSMVSELA